MPRGDKSTYTDKQKRQAEHIEEGYEKRGVPEDEAARRAWATVILSIVVSRARVEMLVPVRAYLIAFPGTAQARGKGGMALLFPAVGPPTRELVKK